MSGRGRWQRVLDARRQAREALGRDPHQVEMFDAPPKQKSRRCVSLTPPAQERRRDESIVVLTRLLRISYRGGEVGCRKAVLLPGERI